MTTEKNKITLEIGVPSRGFKDNTAHFRFQKTQTQFFPLKISHVLF